MNCKHWEVDGNRLHMDWEKTWDEKLDNEIKFDGACFLNYDCIAPESTYIHFEKK